MASEIYAINSDPLAASPSRFNYAAKSYRRVRSSFQDELNSTMPYSETDKSASKAN